MKRVLCFVFVLMLLFLCACGGEGGTVYDVTVNGKVCTIDTENKTITCEGQVCGYSISGGSSRTRVEITYPDGATYFSTVNKGGNMTSTASGWSESYEKGSRVLPGGDLVDALLEGRPRERSGGSWLIGLLAVGLGVWNVASPRTAWYLAYGWRYKDAEPSDAALFFERVGGMIAVIAGIILFFV